MKVPIIRLVFDRRKVSNAKKEGTVDLCVTYDRTRKFLSTGVYCYPREWDKIHECVKLRPDATILNESLINLKKKVMITMNKMIEDGLVDMSVLNTISKSHIIDISFPEYIESRAEKRIVHEHTRARYWVFLRVFKEWSGMEHFADITVGKVREWDEWLHSRIVGGKHLEQSTIYTYHKYLKLFINDAIVDGFVTLNPYSRYKIERGESGQIDSLTEEQVTMIERLVLGDSLGKVRDLFLFQCYTGLAYSDLAQFDITKYKEDEDGIIVVTDKRVKTNTTYTFVLLPQAREIVEKYNNRLPIISNQKYNTYLKVIGGLIGVNNLHSHMGRSTFASTMLNNGMNTDVLKHCLGHTTTLQTNRYATMRNKTIKDAFKGIKKEGSL